MVFFLDLVMVLRSNSNITSSDESLLMYSSGVLVYVNQECCKICSGVEKWFIITSSKKVQVRSQAENEMVLSKTAAMGYIRALSNNARIHFNLVICQYERSSVLSNFNFISIPVFYEESQSISNSCSLMYVILSDFSNLTILFLFLWHQYFVIF